MDDFFIFSQNITTPYISIQLSAFNQSKGKQPALIPLSTQAICGFVAPNIIAKYN